MRVLFLGNNWLGWQTLRWLRQQEDEVVGLVLHARERRSHGEEILAAASLPTERVFLGADLHRAEVREAIRALRPDIGVSVMFGHLLKKPLLDVFPLGCLNLHPSLLPYNRGAFPNVWSILDGTPAGATLHYVDECLDTGDIVAQTQVSVEPIDTGESLYRKLERAALELFKTAWPAIRMGQAKGRPQDRTAGTFHRKRDIEPLDEIELDRLYSARELINLLRARTFPPHAGAYFLDHGRRVYLRLQLEYDTEAASEAA